jgi:hypothetical protein
LKIFYKVPGSVYDNYYSDLNTVTEMDAETANWHEYAVPIPTGTTSPYRFGLASAPTAITLRDGMSSEIHLFGNRTTGTLLEGIRSGGKQSAIWHWDDSHGPDGIEVQDSQTAALNNNGKGTRGCIDASFRVPVVDVDIPIGRVLPAWVSVDPSDDIQNLEGIVTKSHISREDLPLNHTYTGGEQQIAHDWNINVAPAVAYQGLMSDGNFANGEAEIEVEWEFDYGDRRGHLPIEALPGVGDQVYMKGRWIYDCGHPPYRTEIHPPPPWS